MSRHELVGQAGAHGIEFLVRMMIRGALCDEVRPVRRNYQIPTSDTGAGTTLLECVE